MNRLNPCHAVLLCLACSARPVEEPPRSAVSIPSDAGEMEGDAALADAVPGIPATLDERLELILETNAPVEIARLGLTVTLLEAYRTTSRRPGGGWSHGDMAKIRFERPGEAPLDVRFGKGQRVHTLFGHGFALWGGTQLSVYPPGEPITP